MITAVRALTGVGRRLAALCGSVGHLLGRRKLPAAASYRPPVTNDGQMKDVLESIRRQFRQPAIGAALIHGDHPPVRAVAGTLLVDGNDAATVDHRFHIGSTTKSFTALLVEKGVLRYDMTLAEALPQLEMKPDYRGVTLHDLMLSRAGVILYQQHRFEAAATVEMLEKSIPGASDVPREQRRRLTAYALSLPPVFAPGTKAMYSNVGWAIVGHVAETITGTPYEQLVEERIFAPLAMKGARFGGWPARPGDPRQPRGHYVDGPGRLRAQPLDDGYVLAPWMNPSGGIHCTIDDYARYAQETLHGLGDKGRLLRRSSYARMHTIHARERIGVMYQGLRGRHRLTLGYGWLIVPIDDGATLSAADGSAGTFFARIAVLPALDVAFVGFTNAGDGADALGAAVGRLTGLPWD